MKNKKMDQFEVVLQDFKDYYIAHSCDFTTVYDGIFDLLKEAKDKGIKMAIVSNKYQQGVDLICSQIFSEYINIFIGTRENVNPKPDKAMVELALKELKLKNEECLFVGDSDVDLLTAINSNMKSIGVNWGYKDVSKANYRAYHPLDIIKIINKENEHE